MIRIGFGLILALASTAAVIRPAVAEDRFEVPLGPVSGHAGSGPALSLGSVGVSSNPRDPYFRHGGNDPDHSIIPSERSAGSAPGLLLHFPLGGDGRPRQ